MTLTLERFHHVHKDPLLNYEYSIRPYHTNETLTEWNNETFSTVGFHLTLRRRCIKHLSNYYVPSLLFVVVSWISFAIPPDAIPGRMSLLITLALTLVNLFGDIAEIHRLRRNFRGIRKIRNNSKHFLLTPA